MPYFLKIGIPFFKHEVSRVSVLYDVDVLFNNSTMFNVFIFLRAASCQPFIMLKYIYTFCAVNFILPLLMQFHKYRFIMYNFLSCEMKTLIMYSIIIIFYL